MAGFVATSNAQIESLGIAKLRCSDLLGWGLALNLLYAGWLCGAYLNWRCLSNAALDTSPAAAYYTNTAMLRGKSRAYEKIHGVCDNQDPRV